MKIKFYILTTLVSILFSVANAQYLEKSVFWGGSSSDYFFKSLDYNEHTYISGQTYSSTFNSPNNFTNTNSKGYISKIDSTGEMLQTIQIPNNSVSGIIQDFKVFNDTAYIIYQDEYYVNNYQYNFYYEKRDVNTGNLLFSDTINTFSNYTYYTSIPSIYIDDDAKNVYVTISTNNSLYQTTDSLFNYNGGITSIYLHYDGRTNQILFSSYIPFLTNNPIYRNNKLYLNSLNPQTNNQFLNTCLDVVNDTIINTSTNNPNYTSVFINFGSSTNYDFYDNKFYYTYRYSTPVNNLYLNQIMVFDTIYNKLDSIDIGYSTNNSLYYSHFYGDKIYATLDTIGGLRFKVFENGNLVFNTFYNDISTYNLLRKDGYIHIVGLSKDYNTSDGTLGSNNSDALTYLKIDTTDYSICKSTYIGGVKNSIEYKNPSITYDDIYLSSLKFVDEKIHIVGRSNLENMPRTSGQFQGSVDIFYTIFNTKNNIYTNTIDTLQPKTQTICKNGMAEIIIGQEYVFKSTDSVPLVHLGNDTYEQTIANKVNYQWQEATNINGPYTDILNANSKDYLPIVEEENKYYRRISTMNNCDTLIYLTSDTASVLVNNNFAPEVEIGDIYHTCPNVDVTIGIIPTATNGTPPYQYNWSNGDTTETTLINSNKNELLTLIVTDSNGCKQYDQGSVLIHQAKIKSVESVCSGDSAVIRANTIQGLSGVTYQWTGNNMCCPNSATNIVAPPNSQSYILTVTIPITSGGFCSTSDTSIVEYISTPPTDFAGPDQLVCLGTKVTVGISPVSGFNYSWSVASDAGISPSDSSQAVLTSFYDNPSNSQPNYFTNQMPSTNPLPVIAIMQQNNCLYTDTAYIAYMEAVKENSRKFYCEADLIGHTDRTPNINETYSWVKLSGNALITGPTNQAQLQIDNSPTVGSSTFQLTTSATVNGIYNTCTNNVVVYENYTKYSSQSSCFPITYNGNTYTNDAVIWDTIPSTTENCDTIHEHEINITNCVDFCQYESNGIKTITASYSLYSNETYNYDWSVEIGPTNNFSVINNGKVKVYDNIYRQIKLSITSPNDTSLLLEYFIDVNGGTWNPISYTALDTTLCFPAGSIQIGDPNGGGYSYDWNGPNNFNSNSRNPTVTPPNIGVNNYSVWVIRGSCSFTDYATINVLKLDEEYAGIDLEVCEDSYITLGNPENSNDYHYYWEPNSALWQNGTDSSSSNPEVLVAVSTDYIVHVADEDSFCTASDTVSVTVNNTPTLDIPDFNICKNEDTIIGMPGFSGATFTWTPATGLSCTDCINPTANLNTSQTYTVNILFDGNCIDANYTDIVNVNVVEVNSNMQDIYYCPDGSIVNIGNDAPSGMNDYSWSPNYLLNTPNNRTSSVNNPNGQIAESFYLNFIDNNQCEVFDTVTIIPDISSPAVNAGNSQSICLGESVNIGQQNFSSSANYSWSPTAYLSNINTSYTTFTPLDTGLYTFVLTKEELGTNCISTDTVSIQVTNVEVGDLNYQICQNTCSLIGFTNDPNYDYLWSPSNNLSSNNIASPTICNLNSTQNYNVEVSNAYGCSDNAIVSVGVFNYTPPTVVLNDTTVFTNTPISLNTIVTPSGNSTYDWGNNSYVLNSNTPQGLFYFNQPGVYNLSLEITDINSGCTFTEDVTVTALELNTIINTVIVCDSFTFNQQTYYTNQIIQDTTSLDTINITEYLVKQSQETFNNINFCDSILFNNTWYFDNDTIIENIQTSFGCDSIITTYLIYAESKADSLNISFCDSTFYNGNWYFGSQNIIENYQTAANCDSTFSVILNASYSFEKDSTIRFCDSTFINNIWYFNSQQFTLNEQALNGCDSTTNFILVKNSTETNQNINFCDSILYNNTWYFDNDTIIENLQTSFGCDSIVITHLMANYSSPVIFFDTVFCANETISIPFGDENITSAGNYSYTFVNQNGCDSLVNLSIIEKPIHLFDYPIDSTSCFGDTLILNPKIIFGDSLIFSWANTNNSNIVLTDNYNDILTIQHPNDCEQSIPFNMHFKDCVGSCKLMLPTGFSPNNDGVNDQLVIFDDCRYGIEKFNIKIYNRWGELVFESDDISNTWDGYYKNELAPLGVYTYHITYTKVASDKTDTISGNVTLIK